MKRTTIVSLLIAAVVAIGGIAYFNLRPKTPLDKAPQTATAPATTPAPQPSTPAVTPTPPTGSTAATVATPAPAPNFIFRRLTIDGTRDLIEACFSFS